MAQSVGYSTSDDKFESEAENEIDGVDPWKAAMQVQKCTTRLVKAKDE